MAITVKVLGAELLRSFDTLGKMDPFAVVEWVGPDQSAWEVGRTSTHWGGHMQPVWDQTFHGLPHRVGSADSIRFKVLEKDLREVVRSTFCGEVQIPISELLDGLQDPQVFSRKQALPIKKNGEETGSITVQAMYEHGAGSALSVTPVDSRLFETPVRRIGVSGGTAPFFHLALRSPKPGQQTGHWIGKDLARAADEVAFYEQVRKLAKKEGKSGFEHLFEFMFEYAGVVQVPEEGAAPNVPNKQLLVLENLRNGNEVTRMLDIKIGEKTAAANWQGKSRWAAFRQSVLDGLTNSVGEGFRLEGFDGKPPAFESLDPLLDIRVEGGAAVRKKAMRVMLQRMSACDMLMHFFDVHQTPADPGCADLKRTMTPTEVVEIVHSEVVRQLARLAVACRKVPVAQKWIGSSVALCFDSGKLPQRGTAEDELRRGVRVKIFDWGRSELNTPEHHAQLTTTEKRDRADFWRLYVSGINRLAWEAARAYRHRFGNACEWEEVQVTVNDFDSLSANDFMGSATIKLRPTEGNTIRLRNRHGGEIEGRGGFATLTYTVSYRDLPAGSRLKGAWRITVLKAANLPICDLVQGSSDPYCSLVAVSTDGSLRFRQETAIVKRNLFPEWNETFELPLAAGGVDRLQETLEAAALGLGKGAPLAPLLPPSDHCGASAMGPTRSTASAQDAELQSAWASRIAQATLVPARRKPGDTEGLDAGGASPGAGTVHSSKSTPSHFPRPGGGYYVADDMKSNPEVARTTTEPAQEESASWCATQ